MAKLSCLGTRRTFNDTLQEIKARLVLTVMAADILAAAAGYPGLKKCLDGAGVLWGEVVIFVCSISFLSLFGYTPFLTSNLC